MHTLTDLPNFPRPCIVFASENLSERVCTQCRPGVCQCIVLIDSHSLIKAIGKGRAKTNVHPQNRLVNNSHLSQNPKFAQFFQSVNLNLQKCNSESALELDRVLSFLLQHPDLYTSQIFRSTVFIQGDMEAQMFVSKHQTPKINPK